jgi:tRNA modification GTPase
MTIDTIFALATGAGTAAIGVMRISGPASGTILELVCRRLPAPRVATLRTLRDANGDLLDRALVLWLPGPRSYTGEDSAELHLHGGRAVVDGVADALVAAGARPAEPGEFTERAFLNGRLDLLEAEGVADLIAAETAAQRRLALRQMEGELGAVYRRWSDQLLHIVAQQEALIDFPDEDLPESVLQAIERAIAGMIGEMRRHLDDGARGERLRDGLVFAIVGPPNAGKSTLINTLSGRDVAIVSPMAGTTRDVLEARVVFGGVPVTLLDTAGLREARDVIEAEGVQRARARAARADLVIAMDDAGEPGLWYEAAAGSTVPVLRVVNKIDIGDPGGRGDHAISALTGEGLDTLRQALDGFAKRLTDGAGPPVLTRARHRAAVQMALERLESGLRAEWPELRGEDLRMALRNLGRLTGAVGVDDILDSVFRQFCIGK